MNRHTVTMVRRVPICRHGKYTGQSAQILCLLQEARATLTSLGLFLGVVFMVHVEPLSRLELVDIGKMNRKSRAVETGNPQSAYFPVSRLRFPFSSNPLLDSVALLGFI